MPGVWPGSGIRTSLPSPNTSRSTFDGIRRLAVVPVGAQIAGGLRTGRLRRLDLPGMHHDGRLLEELVAAAVIGVEVRIDDDVDVVGVDADAGQIWQKRVLRAHHRRHHLHQRAPAFLAVLDDGRMAAGVEQHVALLVPDQRAGDGRLERLAAIGGLVIDAFLQAQPAGGKKLQLHVALPLRKRAAARIAATMF